MKTLSSTARAQETGAVEVLDDDARVGALLSPLRRRLLGMLRQEPGSATSLARRLAVPRQRLNYHLRALERAGLLELAEERQRRGCVERAMRPTARAFLVDPGLLGDLAPRPEAIADRFSSAYLVALSGQMARQVSTLARGAARAGRRLPTFSLATEVQFRSGADRAAFAEELTATLARLTARFHQPAAGSRAYRFVIGGHPVLTGERTGAAGPRRPPPSARRGGRPRP